MSKKLCLKSKSGAWTNELPVIHIVLNIAETRHVLILNHAKLCIITMLSLWQ